MKMFSFAVTMFIAVACTAPVSAQQQAVPAPSSASQATVVSEGQTAMNQAAASGKFALIFFWKDKSAQTDKAFGALTTAAASLADSAAIVSIQATNTAEKAIIDRYGVSRAPMPLILAVAPCGAITKAFTGPTDEKQLRAAFVSPGTQLCLKGLQDRKLVFVCVVDQASPQDPVAVPKGVEEFTSDTKYRGATEVVLLNAQEPAEAAFLKSLQVNPGDQKPVSILMAPPGSVVGKFTAVATKAQIAAKLTESQSNPCAGGKCGPGGCGPKK